MKNLPMFAPLNYLKKYWKHTILSGKLSKVETGIWCTLWKDAFIGKIGVGWNHNIFSKFGIKNALVLSYFKNKVPKKKQKKTKYQWRNYYRSPHIHFGHFLIAWTQSIYMSAAPDWSLLLEQRLTYLISFCNPMTSIMPSK